MFAVSTAVIVNLNIERTRRGAKRSRVGGHAMFNVSGDGEKKACVKECDMNFYLLIIMLVHITHEMLCADNWNLIRDSTTAHFAIRLPRKREMFICDVLRFCAEILQHFHCLFDFATK